MTRRKEENRSKHLVSAQEVPIRVRKACERCRLKKCKCDGVSPCRRCLSDDLICGYNQRRTSDKIIYRKGYVQMLERQRVQLTAGVQKLYQRQQNGYGSLDGRPKDSQYEKPPTHEILKGLGILDSTEWHDFHLSESIYEDSEAYSPGNSSFIETTTPPVTRSILPATQIAFPSSPPTIDLDYDHHTDLCATLGSSSTGMPYHSQPEMNSFDICYLNIDDNYVSGFNMHSTA